MTNMPILPLSDAEFVELGELLASLPDEFEPMEPDYMDGFLTALLCLPHEPAPSEWMPFLFDKHAQPNACLPNEADQDRLEELIYRRYRQIDQTLAACKPIDPIIYEIEDSRGHPVRGYDSIAAVIPFALGFVEVIERWPGLKDNEDETVSSALLGILRHLPDDVAGDLSTIKEDLDLESPLENLDQALEDIALSVAEIASVTRGFVETKSTVSRPAAHRGKPDRKERRPFEGEHQARRSGPSKARKKNPEHHGKATSKGAASKRTNPFGSPRPTSRRKSGTR